MINKASTFTYPSATAPTYPNIQNLVLANSQYHRHPAQYNVSRCVCCRKVRTLVVRVSHHKIIEQLAEHWQELGEDIAPNLGGMFCPDCRAPGEDWEIVNLDGRRLTIIHRPSQAAAQAYLDQHQSQYKNCTLRPRAPT